MNHSICTELVILLREILQYFHGLPKMKYARKLGVVALAFMAGVHAADAADLSVNERIKRAWYVAGGVGAEALTLHFKDASVKDVAANSYWGIAGTAEICKAGIGSATWLDLCAGGHMFKSLGSASQEIAARIGGGISKTDVLSYGAFVKAKAHMGAFMLSPYAGVRKIKADVSTTNINVQARNADATALFGGAELGFTFWNDSVEWGLGGEVGKSTSGEKFNYYKAGTFLRMKF